MKPILFGIGFTMLFFCTLFSQTLPIEWEINVGPGLGGDIDVQYLGRIDNDPTGKILVWYQASGNTGLSEYKVYDGSSHIVVYQHSFVNYAANPRSGVYDLFGHRRVAPVFHADFDTNGIVDFFHNDPYAFEFRDPSTGAITLSDSFQVVDVDDVDNDGTYEMVVYKWIDKILRIYDTRRTATSVPNLETLPKRTDLKQNYPNPFNPVTTISYDLTTSGDVTFNIYDVSGRLIQSFNLGHQEMGSHEVIWDGRDKSGSSVSSGVYFYRLIFNRNAFAKKMLLLR